MSIPTQPNIKLVNAADYREGYANSVQVRVSVWDFFLVFGTLQQQSESQVEIKNFQGSTSLRLRPPPPMPSPTTC